jgi:hypothetical protein
LLLALGVLSMTPDSDTGERAATISVVASVAVGAAAVALCVPVTYLFAHDRILAGLLLTAVGIGVAALPLYAG